MCATRVSIYDPSMARPLRTLVYHGGHRILRRIQTIAVHLEPPHVVVGFRLSVFYLTFTIPQSNLKVKLFVYEIETLRQSFSSVVNFPMIPQPYLRSLSCARWPRPRPDPPSRGLLLDLES